MPRVVAPVPPNRRVRRFVQLLVGLVLFGVTAAMLVLANLGLDPWNVLHQGLSRTLGLGIGTWAIIVSFIALIGWLPLPHRPGIGTLANAILIGLVIDVVLARFHAPHGLLERAVLLAGGVLGMGLATGLYIGAGLGAGPRDGLSVGIVARGGYSMRVVRTSVEASVLLIGWLLGGTVGIGTVLFAVTIGPITHVTIPALAIDREPVALGASRRRRSP
ncbi:MAG: YczE/YyaS/YitT family protein [Solirubrobacteraceae bacterium]